jgi:tRNA pseudouridine38-40 synthase
VTVGPDTPGARNLKLTLEYDGAGFHGWQRQAGGLRTVQGEIEAAAAILFGHPVVARVSGRTDAGVHALAQIVNLYTHRAVPLKRVLRGLNGLCGLDVRVLAVEEVPVGWEARVNARGKWYRYLLLPRSSDSALQRGRVWRVNPGLDLDVLAAELSTLPGTAHWGAYRAKDCSSPYPVKTLFAAELERWEGDVVAIRFHGSGFLKQMVRILVGTAVDVGRGQTPPGSMVRIRETQDRTQAGPTAPAHGLYLERVLYDPVGVEV